MTDVSYIAPAAGQSIAGGSAVAKASKAEIERRTGEVLQRDDDGSGVRIYLVRWDDTPDREDDYTGADLIRLPPPPKRK